MSRHVKIIALMVGGGVQFGLLIINLLITSKMHIDERGIYALIVAVVMTVSGVCNFGFVNALIKRMQAEKLAVDYVSNLFYLIVIQIVAAIGVVFTVLSSFPVITYEALQQYGLFVTFIIISLLLRSYGQALLLGLNRINLFQASKVVPVVSFVLILLVQDRYFLADVLFAWMASELLLVLLLVVCTVAFLRTSAAEKDSGFFKDLKFGLKSLFGHTAFIEGYKFDLIVLGYIIPVADLAIYAVSKSVASVLRFVPQSLSQVAYPVILKADKLDKAAIIKKYVLAAISSGAVLIVVGYFLFVNFVIDYLGDDYAESAYVVLVMFLGVLAYAPRRILYEYFKAVNVPGITSKIEVLIIIGYVALLFTGKAFGFTDILMLAFLILALNSVALIFTLMLTLKKVNEPPVRLV